MQRKQRPGKYANPKDLVNGGIASKCENSVGYNPPAHGMCCNYTTERSAPAEGPKPSEITLRCRFESL